MQYLDPSIVTVQCSAQVLPNPDSGQCLGAGGVAGVSEPLPAVPCPTLMLWLGRFLCWAQKPLWDNLCVIGEGSNSVECLLLKKE